MTPYELWFSSKPKLSFLKVWSLDAYMKKVFNLISSNPNRRSASSYNTQRRQLGTPSITDLKARFFVAKNGSFLEKEFLSKEVSGRKVELDEVIVPSPLLESSSSQKSVPVIPTPISEEVNDDDHETSDQVAGISFCEDLMK